MFYYSRMLLIFIRMFLKSFENISFRILPTFALMKFNKVRSAILFQQQVTD